MRRFFEGLVLMLTDIILGTFWATIMILGVFGMWFIFYMLVTGFMR